MTNFDIARRFTGLSAADLARKLDVSPQQLNGWLSGQRVPSRTNIGGIAAAMDVSPAWLLCVSNTIVLHDPVEHKDFLTPIVREEEIDGYGMLYHVWLDSLCEIVPVLMSDGMQFTPTDWEDAWRYIKCAADIRTEAEDRAGVRWMDWRGQDAIVLDGLPRVFV